MSKPTYQSTGTGYDLIPITPHDTTPIAPCKAFYITTAGDVVFRTLAGNTRTVTVPANFMLLVGGDLVKSTGTTATGIHGIPF